MLLPIHKTYINIDNTTGEKIQYNAYYDFYIDWGDGEPEKHISCSYADNIWVEDIDIQTDTNIKKHYPDPTKLTTELTSGLLHTYKKDGKYLISIRIDESNTDARLDTLYVHIEDTETWKNLIKIYNIGWLNYKSFENSFCNAVNLDQLPNTPLIPDDIKTLYNASHMFYNCQSIYNIPLNFYLNINLLDTSYMFCNCFQFKKPSTNTNISTIFKNKFSNSLIKINVEAMFKNCINLTGFMRSKNLWYSNTNSWNSVDCFFNCINLDNYNAIPLEWGGKGVINPLILKLKINKPNTYVSIPIDNGNNLYNYYFVTWGDDDIIYGPYTDVIASHTYQLVGEYIVKIWGIIEHLYFRHISAINGTTKFNNAITDILQYGQLECISYASTFYNCTNIQTLPSGNLPFPLNFRDNNKRISYNNMFNYSSKITVDSLNQVSLPINDIEKNINDITEINLSTLFAAIYIETYPTILTQNIKQLYSLGYSKEKIDDKYSIKNNFKIDINQVINLNYINNISSYMNSIYLLNAAINFPNKNNPLYDNNNNQISAIVQQENYFYNSLGYIDTNKPMILSTYILPRYEVDDLIYDNIFLLFNSFNFTGSAFSKTYITTLPDKHYNIICENVNNKTLDNKLIKYDYKKHIENIDYYDYNGPKYIVGSYNETEKTFYMKYKELNQIEETVVKYVFHNCIPISGITYIPDNIPNNASIETFDDIQKYLFNDLSWQKNLHWQSGKNPDKTYTLDTAYKSYSFRRCILYTC